MKKSHVLLTYKLQVLFLLFRHLCGILWHFCDEDWAPVNRTYGEVQIGCPLGLKCLQFRGEVDLSGLSQCNCKGMRGFSRLGLPQKMHPLTYGSVVAQLRHDGLLAK